MTDPQRTILVVDDEASQRQLLGDFVASLDFRAEEAGSAEEALEKIRRGPPDMVLLDVRLPGMDGVAALGEIRKIAADLPVLLITAHGELRQAVEAIKSGAEECGGNRTHAAKKLGISRRTLIYKLRAMECE